MKPTKEQIEKYIESADLELGPMCTDGWVDEVRQYLRSWGHQYAGLTYRIPDGGGGMVVEIKGAVLPEHATDIRINLSPADPSIPDYMAKFGGGGGGSGA